jgi:hypothetical protein
MGRLHITIAFSRRGCRRSAQANPQLKRVVISYIEDIMEYSEEITERIKDPDKWPAFDRGDYLDELDSLADSFMKKGSTEGYLAALLVFQQLAEEIIKLLLECHEFYMQLRLFPAEIKFKKRNKSTFGHIIGELESTVTISDEKQEIINKAKELNEIRISLVHGLTKTPDVKFIHNKVEDAYELFCEISDSFFSEYELFQLTYKDYYKDWDERVSE